MILKLQLKRDLLQVLQNQLVSEINLQNQNTYQNVSITSRWNDAYFEENIKSIKQKIDYIFTLEITSFRTL